MNNEVSSLLDKDWIIIINYIKIITKKMHKNKDGIYIYSEDAYKGIKKACNLASKTLDMIGQFIEPGVTTEELDRSEEHTSELQSHS